jgi:hypothetical protein
MLHTANLEAAERERHARRVTNSSMEGGYMGNRLMVAFTLGIGLAMAACGDDDGGRKPDAAVGDGGNPIGDRDSGVNIDSGMDANTPLPEGSVIAPDGYVFPAPEGGNPGTDGMVMMPQQGTVTKEITGAGGSVTSQDGNLTLTFAPGVVLRPINVTIRQVTTMLPMGTLGGVVYEVAPAWESFSNATDQRRVTASFKYTDAVLGGRSPKDLTFGRFEGGGWIELNTLQPVKNAQGTFVRGDFTKLGTFGLFTGVCEACTQPACVTETCKVGEPAVIQGKCATVDGCSVCVPACDEDGDGYCVSGQSGGIRSGDCAGTNPDIHPNAIELCNGVDDNCDLVIDEGCQTCKVDDECPANSWCEQGTCRPCSVDCTGACSVGFGETSFPGQCKVRGKAGSCSVCVPTCDDDGDRYCEAGATNVGQEMGNDCLDTDITVNPRSIEVCGDNLDNDCDGNVDNGCVDCQTDATCPANNWCSGHLCVACTTTCTPDTCTTGSCFDYGNGCKRCKAACDGDGDGYCINQQGETPGGDYIDNDRTVHPNAIELCGNSKDDDLDGHTDEGCKACATDAECPASSEACINGVCVVCEGSFDPTQRFGATETNRDAGVGAVKLTYGKGCEKGIPACDMDKDGFCDPTKPGGVRDDQVLGWDCDDTDPNINRSQIEVCGNSKDDDCDGAIDENCNICTQAMMCGAANHCTSGL